MVSEFKKDMGTDAKLTFAASAKLFLKLRKIGQRAHQRVYRGLPPLVLINLSLRSDHRIFLAIS